MVKYINVNDEKLPITISYYALAKYQEETGRSIADIGEDSLILLEPLFFYALESGHKAAKQNFDIKREDVVFMLDDCWVEFSTLMGEFFTGVTNGDQKKVKK